MIILINEQGVNHCNINVLPSNAGIPINFRLDGNLFNIRRLQAKTKVSRDTIFDMQYADDAAIPSHTAAGLQHSLDLLAATYQRDGLIVNMKKKFWPSL